MLNDVEQTQFWLYLDIFIFSLIKSLSCNMTLKHAGYVNCYVNVHKTGMKMSRTDKDQIKKKNKIKVQTNLCKFH